jgi:hypothetical protein
MKAKRKINSPLNVTRRGNAFQLLPESIGHVKIQGLQGKGHCNLSKESIYAISFSAMLDETRLR